MNVTVLYVGSSLLAPLRKAEREINREHRLDLHLSAHNFGAPFTDEQWDTIENDLTGADVVFVIHVMDGENASHLLPLLDRRDRATIVINCMPELMKRTRAGKLDFAKLPGVRSKAPGARGKEQGEDDLDDGGLLRSISSWIGRQAKGKGKNGAASHGRADYLKWAERLPGLLRFVPNAGRLRDAKNYLLLVSYFLQPTPNNIRSMILLALKEYVDDERLKTIDVPAPEALPSVGIYHPDAPALFESFTAYEAWYRDRSPKSEIQSPTEHESLAPGTTIGLLLMRPQIVSNARKHYDAIIRAIEGEGLDVIPAISTFMDNREACEKFFVGTQVSSVQHAGRVRTARVSQIVSLTGFSFVGGPAMNDSEAAANFLGDLNIPYRSLVSLDTQTIESWRDSFTGLNPVQTGMQIAIPEIDGATEPFVFGGISANGVEPAALDDRCARIARRLKRWNLLQTESRDELKVALVVYCFPPNKGNIGTAADLDVFASVQDILAQLQKDGYRVSVPESADALRDLLLGGNSGEFGTTANIAYRMKVDNYRQLCPFVDAIETEWGPAPGAINSREGELLIQGVTFGNVFIGVQPTFGFEDDPMRLLMAKGGAPHHGFAAFYSYLERVFKADAIVHVGTHGAMEFMPGKQVGMSGECWPDRLIGELPNIYIYSVNNPSEGTIAKRRSYAQLISYLTPPIENAGLYKGLATLKDLIESYRFSTSEEERERIYQAIENTRKGLNLELS
ncbi:MAG TPA: cobaltochelatase subunit CobN [Pyrinomonadaceae bacterium]|nr:cobaltochelatase subunit CobN [Pyrinomonadaceae bacterium]